MLVKAVPGFNAELWDTRIVWFKRFPLYVVVLRVRGLLTLLPSRKLVFRLKKTSHRIESLDTLE